MKYDLYVQEEWLRHLNMLHHALRLPAAVHQGSRCLMALPEKAQEPRETLRRGEVVQLLARRAAVGKAAYLPDGTGCGYVGLRLPDDGALLLGPFTQPGISTGADKASLAVPLGEDSLFYMTKLLEELLESAPPAPVPDAKEEGEQKAPPAKDPAQLFSHPPYFLEQKLAHHISQGNGEKALRYLREINRLERARVAGDPVRSLKNSLIGICALCSRAAITGGLTADSAFAMADSFIRTIEETDTSKALIALEEEIVKGYADSVQTRRSSILSPIVLAAARYIDDHLMEKIHLADIAARVYVHPDYLGVRFKKEMGETVGRFIQKRRIDEACRFLRSSDYAIADIAAYCQFSSQSALTKVFRQYQGVTPLKYRQQHIKTW